jgi:hypothetical protein
VVIIIIIIIIIIIRSQDSSVGIAMGWSAGVRFPVRARDFYLLYSVQTGSGAHPASYPMGTGVQSPGVKLPGSEADHSTPSSAEVKNSGFMPALSHTSSWLCA